jgi:hypothetical protein
MTIDELLAREAIRATMARCAMAGDHRRADDYADCFTPDGVLQSERADGTVNLRHAGREDIRAWQKAWKSGDASQRHMPRAAFAQHSLSTCEIALISDTDAAVHTYWTVWTEVGPDHCGFYLDAFRREGEAWLIAQRRIRTTWHAPQSVFVRSA